MSEHTPIADLKAALRSQLTSPSHKRTSTVAGRKAGERRARGSYEGRHKWNDNATVQFNVMLTPDRKARLVNAKRDHGKSFAELIDLALELLSEHLDGGRL
jgi:hypothetical protein